MTLEIIVVFPPVFTFGCIFPLAGSTKGLEGGMLSFHALNNSVLNPLKFQVIFPSSQKEEKLQYYF